MFKDEAVSSALIVWLVLLLAFVSVGVSIPLSIMLGGIAGLCWAFIISWRLTKDKPGEAWANRLSQVVKTSSGKVNLVEAQKRAREQIKGTRLGDAHQEQKQDSKKGGFASPKNLMFWRRRRRK